jgi:hypothetical protein
MTVDIKETMGGAISEDTERLLGQFNSNFEKIESNFNDLKTSIEELK